MICIKFFWFWLRETSSNLPRTHCSPGRPWTHRLTFLCLPGVGIKDLWSHKQLNFQFYSTIKESLHSLWQICWIRGMWLCFLLPRHLILKFILKVTMSCVVVHFINPSTWETDALWVQGQLGLCRSSSLARTTWIRLVEVAIELDRALWMAFMRA